MRKQHNKLWTISHQYRMQSWIWTLFLRSTFVRKRVAARSSMTKVNPKICYFLGSYRKHQITHGERMYICKMPTCGKRFLDNSKLKRHFLVHTVTPIFFILSGRETLQVRHLLEAFFPRLQPAHPPAHPHGGETLCLLLPWLPQALHPVVEPDSPRADPLDEGPGLHGRGPTRGTLRRGGRSGLPWQRG